MLTIISVKNDKTQHHLWIRYCKMLYMMLEECSVIFFDGFTPSLSEQKQKYCIVFRPKEGVEFSELVNSINDINIGGAASVSVTMPIYQKDMMEIV